MMKMEKLTKAHINFKVNLCVYFGVLLLLSTIFFTGAEMSCDSCGRECARACGTKHFRTCCFNYLRKRSSPMETEQTQNALPQNTADALLSFDQKLETWIRDTKDLEDTLRQTITLQTANSLKKRTQPASSDEFMELP